MASLIIGLSSALALAGLGELRGAPDRASLAVGVMLVWGVAVALLRPPKGGIWALFGAALAVRAILLATPPTLSDDLYRYLWEGRATLGGGDPYLHAPAWAGWPADAMRAKVNHPEISTIYPPLAQWIFAGLGALWYDPLAIKVAMGLADAGTAVALGLALRSRGGDGRAAWLYALHPLGAVESAGSGHLDALALLLLVLAIGHPGRLRGPLYAGLGALVKVFPAVILVPLLRAPGRRLPKAAALALVGAVGMLTLWPFREAGPALARGLGTYAQSWSFNGALFPVIQAAFDAAGQTDLARPVAVAAGAVVVLAAIARRRDPAEVALWAGGAAVLLSPTVHPWYIPWAWVPALLVGWRAWTALATLAPLAYVVLATLDPTTGTWQEQPWTRAAIYLPFLLLWAAECAWRATRPGPWATGASPAGAS